MAAYETHEGQASVAKDGSVTLTRTFKLDTGNAALRPAWGIVAIGIDKYDPHPDDATCLAIEVQSSPVSGELGWFDVSYTYSNRPFDTGVADTGTGDPGSQDPTQQPNPTLRTPVVRWGSNTRMVPFTKDKNVPAKPVQNSAKQPFEGLTVEAITTTIAISFAKGSTTNIRAKQEAYVNQVNDANFTLIPAHGAHAQGTLRCNAWNGTLQFEAGYGWYCQCDVELEYKSDGWDIDVLDMGMYERVNTGTMYVEQKIIDVRTGLPADAPVKLNGAGAKLPDGGADVYLTFRPYKWTSFANLLA